MLPPIVTDLLAHMILGCAHCFKSIICFTPFPEDEGGLVVMLHPRPIEDFVDYNESQFRLSQILVGGPPNIEVSEDGMTLWMSPPRTTKL